MELIEFIKSLEGICPSESGLRNTGFEGRHLDIIRKGYRLTTKDKKNEWSELGIIGKLVDSFDVSYLSFNYYRFKNEINQADNLYFFCTSSYSLIGLNKSSGEIMEIDTDEFETLNRCAKDGESFLKALLVFLELESSRLQNLVEMNDELANSKCYNECVEAAGGTMYRNFYKQIIFP
jgi:hypothetical protein